MLVCIDINKLILEERFKELFLQDLGQETFERALKIYKDYGFLLSFCVLNVIAWAIKKNKVEKVLFELENYWENNPVDLKSQDLKDRGLNPAFKKEPMTAPVIDPRVEQDFFILELEREILQL